MAQLDAQLAAIDAETNNLATVVQGLRDQIKTSMTPAEVDAAKTKLDQIANQLKGIAAGPTP
jgi:hypothetical protein